MPLTPAASAAPSTRAFVSVVRFQVRQLHFQRHRLGHVTEMVRRACEVHKSDVLSPPRSDISGRGPGVQRLSLPPLLPFAAAAVSIAARPASKRATGMRNGEQDT